MTEKVQNKRLFLIIKKLGILHQKSLRLKLRPQRLVFPNVKPKAPNVAPIPIGIEAPAALKIINGPKKRPEALPAPSSHPHQKWNFLD